MSDVQPLTAEEIAALDRGHGPVDVTSATGVPLVWCSRCVVSWPCPSVRIAAALAAERERADRAERERDAWKARAEADASHAAEAANKLDDLRYEHGERWRRAEAAERRAGELETLVGAVAMQACTLGRLGQKDASCRFCLPCQTRSLLAILAPAAPEASGG